MKSLRRKSEQISIKFEGSYKIFYRFVKDYRILILWYNDKKKIISYLGLKR